MVSGEAASIAGTESNASSRRRLRTRPMPCTASSIDGDTRLPRSRRLNELANRCDSSRAACSRRSAAEPSGSATGDELPGTNTSSLRLARPATGTLSSSRARRILVAALTCPLPPSTSTRSGSGRLSLTARV